MWYYKYLPDILLNKFDFIHLLFGIGSSSSGYMYSRFYNIYSTATAWTIENEVANQLIGNGIIGTFAVYTWIFKRFKKCKKINHKALMCAIVVGGLTYSYLVNWVWMVIFMFSVKDIGENQHGK